MARRKPSRSSKTAKRRAPARPRALKARKAKKAAKKSPAKKARKSPKKRASQPPRTRKAASPRSARRPVAQTATVRGKVPRLNRTRRTLIETPSPAPPSSLDMDRHASAARTGRAEMAENRRQHAGMTSAITAGDVDVNVENAYFSGDEAPGGDNPTPDQDIVDEIGKALGVEYQDNEELRSGDKLADRDKHRWELDPASSDDYKDRG